MKIRYGHNLIESDLMGNKNTLAMLDFAWQPGFAKLSDKAIFDIKYLEANRKMNDEGFGYENGWMEVAVFRDLGRESAHKNEILCYRIIRAKREVVTHDPLPPNEIEKYEKKFHYRIVK